MTESHRDARLCLAGAALCTASGIYFAVQPSWLCVLGFYGALVLGYCQRRLVADHRRQSKRREQARRAAILDETALKAADVPIPCCSYWRHSEGKVHGPDCTRPPLPRRDTARLTRSERTAFEEITSRDKDSAA